MAFLKILLYLKLRVQVSKMKLSFLVGVLTRNTTKDMKYIRRKFDLVS